MYPTVSMTFDACRAQLCSTQRLLQSLTITFMHAPQGNFHSMHGDFFFKVLDHFPFFIKKYFKIVLSNPLELATWHISSNKTKGANSFSFSFEYSHVLLTCM